MCITFTLGIRGFINLWIGKENYIISYLTVCLFSMILFVKIIYLPLLSLIKAKGLFKDNRNHIFISAITNIIISLILIKNYGLEGLLIGTLVAYLINLILKVYTVNNKILKGIKHKKMIVSYILVIFIFIVLSIILKLIEETLILTMSNILISIILLGVVFISISFESITIFCSGFCISSSGSVVSDSSTVIFC